MTECNQIKESIWKEDEGLSEVLDIFYDPDKEYSRAAKKAWKKFKGNKKFDRVFYEWRELFWAAFNIFVKRVNEEKEKTKKIKKDEVQIPEGGRKKRKYGEPIGKCLEFFKSTCYFLALEATRGRIVSLEDVTVVIANSPSYNELLWNIMESNINLLDDKCRRLLVAKHYQYVNDNAVLSKVTQGSVKPGGIPPTIAECKNKLKRLIAGIDLEELNVEEYF